MKGFCFGVVTGNGNRSHGAGQRALKIPCPAAGSSMPAASPQSTIPSRFGLKHTPTHIVCMHFSDDRIVFKMAGGDKDLSPSY
jgi:hypothetical protein